MPEDARNYGVRPAPWLIARGRPCILGRHAEEGMVAERPPVRPHHILEVLERPDHDDGKTAHKRIGTRTILVRYLEDEEQVVIVSVSATRRRLRP